MMIDPLESRRVLSVITIGEAPQFRNGDQSPWIEETAVINEGTAMLFVTRTKDSANDGISQLWKTDGTAAGTARLLEYTSPSSSTATRKLVGAGDQAFFVARTSKHGAELWRTNGTIGGTRRVADIAPGSRSSRIGELTAVGRKVFFTANDGVHGRELWQSDGTSAGTIMLGDLHPAGTDSAIGELTPVGSRVFFLSRADPSNFGEPKLGVTDGTPVGTKLFHTFDGPYATQENSVVGFDVEIRPDAASISFPRSRLQLASAGSTLIATVAGGSMIRVFRSDGTSTGTTLVQEVNQVYASNAWFENIEAISADGRVFLGTRNTVTPGFGSVAKVLYVTDGITVNELPPGTDTPTAAAIAIGSKLLWLAPTEDSVTLFAGGAASALAVKTITFTAEQRANGLDLGRFVATSKGGIFSVRTNDASYLATESVFHVSPSLKVTKLAAFEPIQRGSDQQSRAVVGDQAVIINGSRLILPKSSGGLTLLEPFAPKLHVESDEQSAAGQNTLTFALVFDNGLHMGGVGDLQVISPVGEVLTPELTRRSGDGTLVSPYRSEYVLRRSGGWVAKHSGRYKVMTSSFYVGSERVPPQSVGTFLLQRPAVLGKIMGRVTTKLSNAGVVTNSDQPLSGLRVFIDRNSNFRFDPGEPFTRSGADGAYALTDLPEGAYNLSFTPLPSLIFPQRTTFSGTVTGYPVIFPNTLNLRSGEFYTQHFSFTEGANLRGQARTDRGDLPVVNLPIFVDLNRNGTADANEPRATTANDGTFAIYDVPPGKWSAISIPGERYAPYQSSLAIYPGEVNTVDIRQRMYKTLRVSAIVRESGMPLRGTIFWVDSDFDAKLDVDEIPIAANSQGKATITALQGQSISFQAPSGYRAAYDARYSMSESGSATFEFTRTPLVRVNAFRDFNGNGRQDDAEYTQTGGFHYQVTTVAGDVVYDTSSSASYYFPPTSFELPMAGEYIAQTMYGVNFEDFGLPVRFKVRAGEERELLIPYKPD